MTMLCWRDHRVAERAAATRAVESSRNITMLDPCDGVATRAVESSRNITMLDPCDGVPPRRLVATSEVLTRRPLVSWSVAAVVWPAQQLRPRPCSLESAG